MSENEKTTYTKSGIKVTRSGQRNSSTPEEDKEIRELEEAAQHESGVTIGFRWGRGQLEMVNQVADIYGIPYQTYIKQAIYGRALEDLRRLTGNSPTPVLMKPYTSERQPGQQCRG